MRTTITYRTLSAWPNNVKRTAPDKRKHSPFRSTWSRTLADLDTELVKAYARNVVIEIDAPQAEIRRHGMPKADARTRSPGVILQYDVIWRNVETKQEVRREHYVFPCDTYHDWQDNVRAIAKTLEALRAVDRYGVTRDGQQFAGFKSIPAQTGTTLSIEQAATILATESGIAFSLASGYEAAQRAFRTARSKTHPDAGGDAARFSAVNVAGQRLAAHFGKPL